MALQNQALKSKTPPLSPEAMREHLLRPFPQVSPRSVIIALVVIGVLIWAWTGSQPDPTINRVKDIFDPIRSMFDLIGRMFPPEFEWARNSEVTYEIFGRSVEIGWPVVIGSVLVTIQMALIGTLGAVLLSLPISLLAARNTSPHPMIYQVVRLILNFMRSIPELVYALLFVAAIGLGPFTGVLALAFGSVGSLSRVYAEAIEQIDPQQVLALRATGATNPQTLVYGVLPQALPLLISYSIVYFESNVRHATILGLVGAGGVGLELLEYSGMGDYQKLFGTALILVVAVTIIDRISSSLRQRII